MDSGDVKKRWLKSARQVVRIVIYLAIFLAVMFLPAGRLDWWEGWAFLGGFLIYTAFLTIWMRRHDPELAEERTQVAANVKGWDNVIMAVYTVLLLALIVITSLDSGRCHWTPTPLAARLLALLGLFFSMVLIWRVMAENTYLSERVRIQEERGHRVVDSGPYRIVRHPMYIGIIVAIMCIPVTLGSWLALIPGALIAALFVLRTALEDRTLKDELPGYEAYAERVRYRLLPGIW